MKNKGILLIKGFFMGVANIIPGVSGGTLAITLGIYERLLEAISHFFKKFKENISFLIPIGIGAVLSIVLGSRIIEFSLENYPLPTILFFTGLILGGIPMLYKKVQGHINGKNLIIFILTFAFVIGIMFLKSGSNVNLKEVDFLGYFLLFFVGVVAAATMIIPGISGSFMLMVMGYYKPILNVINEFTSFENVMHNFFILLPFGLGVLVGIVGIAKILEYLFKRFEVPTYFGVLGFVLSSIIGIFVQTPITITFFQIVAGILLFSIGFVIAYKLGD